VLAVSLFAAALAGCGSENKEGSIGTGPGGVAKVDETSCAQCHSTALEALTGDAIYANYNQSLHKLNNVGCQDCHGGGAMHKGIGPIPYSKPGNDQCATCHDTLVTAFVASKHGPTEFTIEAAVDENHRKCSRCHSHQGAIQANASGFTGDSDFMAANADRAPGILSEELTEGMKCVTCHVTHKTDDLRVPKALDGTPWKPSQRVGSAVSTDNQQQFNLCTSCHSYTNPDGTLVASGTAGTAKFFHNTTWYRIIGTTHYDNPATTSVIEGYVMRTNGANPCFDCHGHEYKTGTRQNQIPPQAATIYTDWAKSAHSGKLLEAKYAAAKDGNTWKSNSTTTVEEVMAAGVTEETGAGWVHYDWDSAGRASCQRCHTATGAANFMTSPSTYSATNNNFAHLEAGQNEVLYCWGCHTNAGTGELRKPGAITENYAGVNNAGTGTTGTSVTVSYPDIAGSNVCMTCHLGREIGENIKTITDADGVLGFVNSHYLTAGGQLFGKTGYEYATRSYAKPAFFAHDKIGTAAAPGTGSNGPCAGCHMTTPNSHSFLPVTKDSAGAITAIASTACATCHAGAYALTPEALTAEEEEYVASLEALKAALAGKGILFFNAHPYFYIDTNSNGIADPGEIVSSNAFTNWAGVYGLALWKDVMGAAFNANLLIHDPGGYAHNRFYVKRLIWDSIDFIYDGVLNNDVAAAIDAQVTATRLDSATATAAKAYLGTTRP